MFSNLDTNGLMLVSTGLLIRFVIGRRRFKRRNLAGLQVFSNYSASLIIRLFERLFSLFGLLLIALGLVTLLMRF